MKKSSEDASTLDTGAVVSLKKICSLKTAGSLSRHFYPTITRIRVTSSEMPLFSRPAATQHIAGVKVLKPAAPARHLRREEAAEDEQTFA